MHARVLLTVAVSAALGAAGCGSGDPHKIASVSGRVTLNGKPLEKATVMFTPMAAPGTGSAGPASMGITDADGHYSLKTIALSESSGAVIGKHRVRITNAGEVWDPDVKKGPPPKPANPIPEKYNRLEGGLEFDVPAGGTSKADFTLTSP